MQKKVHEFSSAGSASEGISVGPGSTVGILGGGQLGRMFGIAARRMGYRVHAFEPHPDSPAGQISDVEINAPYTDSLALERFARQVDVISFEFENIPLSAIKGGREPASAPPARRGIAHLPESGEGESPSWLEHGFPHASFAVVESPESLRAALSSIGTPSVLKTADFGYDGKGQVRLDGGVDVGTILAAISFIARRARRVDSLRIGALRDRGTRPRRPDGRFSSLGKSSQAAHSRHLNRSRAGFPRR